MGASHLAHTLYVWIYAFHMPAFVFLAGVTTKPENWGPRRRDGHKMMFASRVLIESVIRENVEKLGRVNEGMSFLNRAGNGPWSSCRNAALPTAPGTIRP